MRILEGRTGRVDGEFSGELPGELSADRTTTTSRPLSRAAVLAALTGRGGASAPEVRGRAWRMRWWPAAALVAEEGRIGVRVTGWRKGLRRRAGVGRACGECDDMVESRVRPDDALSKRTGDGGWMTCQGVSC